MTRITLRSISTVTRNGWSRAKERAHELIHAPKQSTRNIPCLCLICGAKFRMSRSVIGWCINGDGMMHCPSGRCGPSVVNEGDLMS